MEINIYNESELGDLVKVFLEYSTGFNIVFLYGDLGAGKTTFVKNLLSTLNTEDPVSSPTYSIINEYKLKDEMVYHIDLYRLDDTDAALEIAIEDYLYSGYLCLVEWPQIIENLVQKRIEVKIENHNNGGRKFSFSKIA